MLYYEDFAVGQTIELGSRTLTQEKIIAFARQFDPQPFHLDPVKARDSLFGTLVASGWHTASTYMRLLVDSLLLDSAAQASPGLDSLRWLKPVQPGDTLTGYFTVLDMRVSASRPSTGIIKHAGEMVNQRQEPVMRVEGITFMGLSPQKETG